MIEEVQSLETSSHQNETCISSISDDNLTSGLKISLIHGQNLSEEKTKPMEENIKHKPKEVNINRAKRPAERVENVPRTDGIHQKEESTGTAFKEEIESSVVQTSKVRQNKETINLVSSEMGKGVDIETAESIIEEDLNKSVEPQVTPKVSTETNTFSPVQGGVCFHPSEQVEPQQVFSSNSERSKIITEPSTTEMAKHIPTTEGFLLEAETAAEHISENKKGLSAKKSSLKSKVNKFAKKVANKIGSLVETESIESLEDSRKVGKACESKSKSIAKEVSTLNPVQGGASSISLESVSSLITEEIIEPEKAGAIKNQRKTERANNVPIIGGLEIEEEMAGAHTKEKSSEEIANFSKVKSDCNASVIQFPSDIGISEEPDSLQSIDEVKQEGAVPNETKVKRMTQNAENMSKSIGVNLEDERINVFNNNHFDGQTVNTSEARSQSQETVSLVPKKVGLMEETETVIAIPEPNQQVTDKAKVSLVKKKTEKVSNIPKTAGITLEEETFDIHSEKKMEEKTVGISKIRSQSSERAVLIPSQVGSSGEAEIVQPITIHDGQSDKLNISTVTKKSERAKKIPKSEGVQLKEETTGFHPIELPETDTVVAFKVRSNSKEKVKLESKEVGVTKEPEALKPLDIRKKEKTARKQTTRNIKNISEKVSNISGDLLKEDYAENMSQEFPQNQHISLSQHTDTASETATLMSTSMGSEFPEAFVGALGEEEVKQISAVPEKENRHLTEAYTKEPSIIGQCDSIFRTEELITPDVQGNKADIKSSVVNKNISSNMPTEVGISILPSSTEYFSVNPNPIETPKVEMAKIERELAPRSEKIIGSNNNGEIVEDFQTETIKNEIGQTVKQKDFESYRQVSNIQGFEPIESSVEEIKLSQENIQQLANKTSTRSVSTERSAKIPLSVGFRPKENKTEIMAPNSSDSQLAKIKSEEQSIGEKVEKMSHVGGFSYDIDEPEHLMTEPVEESRINPKLIKAKKERASSLGRTVGFQQHTEKVKPNREPKRQEEQKPNVSKVPVEMNLASSNDVTLGVSSFNN